MKNIYPLLLLLLICFFSVNAQNVNVDGENPRVWKIIEGALVLVEQPANQNIETQNSDLLKSATLQDPPMFMNLVPVGSTSINFDDMSAPCGFVSTVPILNQYQSYGVTFSGTGFSVLNECGNFSVTGHSSPNFLCWNSCCSGLSETMTFTPKVHNVSFLAGSNLGATLKAEAFDQSDNSLGAVTLVLTSAVQTVNLPYPNIVKIVITIIGNPGIIDNLSFVPDLPPVIACPADINVNNNTGQCGAVVNYLLPEITDDGCELPTTLPNCEFIIEYEGHHYFILQQSQNWPNSKAIAESLGGYLAIFETAAENKAVNDVLKARYPGGTYWIGGHQDDGALETYGGWKWINGTPVSYMNWREVEPNNAGGAEQALMVYCTDGMWNDESENNARWPVFEFSCLEAELTLGLASGSLFPVGTTTVTYQAEDENGNSSACSFTVEVIDAEYPHFGEVGPIKAEYFDFIHFSHYKYGEPVTAIDFNWYGGSPNVSLLGGDYFSIRYTSSFTAPVTGAYNFRAVTDDGFRLYLGDDIIMNHWVTQDDPSYNVNVNLTAGQTLPLKMEFFEYGGEADIHLYYTVPGGTEKVFEYKTKVIADQARSMDADKCNYTAKNGEFDPVFGDNCSATLVNDYNGLASLNGAEFPAGEAEVEWTATDPAGNASSFTFKVTVTDDQIPEAICQDIEVMLEPDGDVSIEPADIDNGSSDNCDFNISFKAPGAGCAEIGTAVHYIDYSELYQPFSSAFYESKYQVLYTAAELMAAGLTSGSVINSVAFNIKEKNTTTPIPGFELSVALLPATTIGGGGNTFATATFNTVRSAAPYSTVAGWNSFSLPTPLAWDGTSGLLIQTCHAGGTNGGTLTDGVYTYPAAGNQVVSGYFQDCSAATGLYTHKEVPQLKICFGSETYNEQSITFDCDAVGPQEVTLVAADKSGNVDECTATVTVKQRPTVLNYIGPVEAKYSDVPVFKAKLTDELTGDPIEGQMIKFTFGEKWCTARTLANGEAGCGFNLLENPCDHETWTIKAEFAGNCPYLGSSDEEEFDYQPEDAIIEYTGTNIAATKGLTSNDFSVVLRAVIWEDPEDEYRGDIREAKARFVVGGTPVCDFLPVTWMDMNGLRAGVVEYLWESTLTTNPTTFDIKIELDGCAYAGFTIDNPLTVYNSVGDFITGGGHMNLTDAVAGIYAPSPDSKMNFGFNVKFNKRGTNLQGKMNIIYRVLDELGEVETIYQIKSNATTSLGTNVKDADAKIAEFVSKANLTDVTDPMVPVVIGGNLTLHVTMTDFGEPGVNDMIGFSLFNGDPKLDPNALWMSSNWVFPETVEQVIDGGNLVVHTSANLNPAPDDGDGDAPPAGGKKKIASLAIGETLFEAYPNPFTDRVVFEFSPAVTGQVRIEILDLNGRLIRTVFDQSVDAGNNYQATFEPGTAVEGLYLYRATIGNDVRFGKLIRK